MATDVWSALADPQRRAMLDLLLERAWAADELTRALELTQPDTSEHLSVLRSAGLVRVRQDAERHVYAAEASPLAAVDAWLALHRGRWHTGPVAAESDEATPAEQTATPEEPAQAGAARDAPPRPDEPHGSFGTVGRRPALQFGLTLGRPVDVVWRAITDPGELARWFPAAVSTDLSEGGAVELTFPGMPGIEAEVTELEPPRRLGLSVWGSEHLRFELRPEPEDVDDRTHLRFMHVLDDRDTAARDAAGWHVCLSRLAAVLEDRPPLAPESEVEERARLHDEYAQLGLPTRAPARAPV